MGREILVENILLMKVQTSLRKMCEACYFVRRGKKLYMRCTAHPRHKRRQGFSTLNVGSTSHLGQSNTEVDHLGGNCHACSKPLAAFQTTVLGSIVHTMEVQKNYKEEEFDRENDE